MDEDKKIMKWKMLISEHDFTHEGSSDYIVPIHTPQKIKKIGVIFLAPFDYDRMITRTKIITYYDQSNLTNSDAINNTISPTVLYILSFFGFVVQLINNLLHQP